MNSLETRKEQCKDLLLRLWTVPPDRAQERLPIKQAIARILAPGIYECRTGRRLRVYGPVEIAGAEAPDVSVAIVARHIDGEQDGQLVDIPPLGDSGFLEPLVVDGKPVERYRLVEAP